MFLLSLLPSFQTFMTLLVLAGTLAFIQWYKMVRFWKKRGIKGPTPVPLLGSMLPEFIKGTIPVHQEHREKYGKIVGTHLGSSPFLTIYDPDMIKLIMVKNSHIFTNHAGMDVTFPLENMLSLIEDDHWKHVRSTLSPTFSGNKLKQMMPHINRCTDNFVKKMDELYTKNEPFDFQVYSGKFTLDVIAATAFGLEIDCQNGDTDPFLHHMNRMKDRSVVAAFFMYLFPSITKFANKVGFNFFPKDTLDFFVDIVERAIQNRQENTSEQTDFLQISVKSYITDVNKENAGKDETTKLNEKGNVWTTRGLTREDILGNAIVFFFAGNDTTSATASYIAYCLATNMECQEKLIAEIEEVLGEDEPTYDNMSKMPYLDKVINESQRLYPVVPWIDRICKETCTINELEIPAGVGVKIPVPALQMDPEVWPEPEKFDPERFSEEEKAKRNPYSFMPFGVGPRICIGQRLALLEIKILFTRTLQKYKLTTCEKTEIPLKLTKMDMKPLNGVYLKLEKRN